MAGIEITKEGLAQLEEGDYIVAEFEETEEDPNDPYGFPQPNGNIYTLRGNLFTISYLEGAGTSLNVRENGKYQCVRDGSGAPGGWLRSIVEHRSA